MTNLQRSGAAEAAQVVLNEPRDGEDYAKEKTVRMGDLLAI